MNARRTAPRPEKPRGPRSAAAWPWLFFVVVAGCARFPGTSVSPAATSHAEGVLLLGKGDFPGADAAFRASASRCESGAAGRSALLFLASLHQDPRNPEAEPDSAVLMAGRALLLPGLTPEERLEAEALYVSALDRGADPGLRPQDAPEGFARRFERCDLPAPPAYELVLPVLERPSASVLRALRERNAAMAERDSMLARENAELRTELERIRKLLRVPDTSVVRSQRQR